jgi:peptide/nickel transport system ATP-binding protein
MSNRDDSLLRVEHLSVAFNNEGDVVRVLDDVSFSLASGEVLGLVGESGCGKSLTAMTIMGLTRSGRTQIDGRIVLGGDTDMVTASERELEAIRGRRVALISQDPLAALTPVYRVGEHIAEQIRAHENVSRKEAWQRAVDLLELVGIGQAAQRARAYPHEFSGGMRQRVMIAMALACSPELLIADEPTTALDVTIQSQILRELADLQRETGIAIILITHDLGVVAEVADRVAVMYGGEIVEEASAEELFRRPMHPYAAGLLKSIPRLDGSDEELFTIPGAPPSFTQLPSGCRFFGRCEYGEAVCATHPELRAAQVPVQHAVRCHLAERLQESGYDGPEEQDPIPTLEDRRAESP